MGLDAHVAHAHVAHACAAHAAHVTPKKVGRF